MGLIRSLIVRLGFQDAEFTAGTKRAGSNLYGLTKQISSFGKAAIALRVSSAALEGFTEWIKAAQEGASNIEILGRGIDAFSRGLPFVNRFVEAFKQLKGVITGSTKAMEVLNFQIGYREKLKTLNATLEEGGVGSKAYKDYETRIKGIEDLTKTDSKVPLFKNAVAVAKSGEVWQLLRMSQQNRDIEFQGEMNKLQGEANDLVIERNKLNSDAFMEEWRAKSRMIEAETELAVQKIKEKDDHAEYINGLKERYDDEFRIRNEYRELLKNRTEIGEAAFGKGEAELAKRLWGAEYTRMQNPDAVSAEPAFVDIKALTASRQDILVKKTEESIIVQKQMRDRLNAMGQGIN